MSGAVAIRLVPLAAAAVLTFSGCGANPEDAPSTDKSVQIAKARENLKTLQRQQAVRERRRAKPEGERVNGASGPRVDPVSSAIESMLAELPGEAGLVVGAPGGDGKRVGSGSKLSSVSAWSTIKVPIVERVLSDAGGPSGISPSQRANISAAITLSDNDAAESLFSDLESLHGGLNGASTAVGEMLRQAGDNETVVSTVGRGFSTYGQTNWTLEEQNKYMAALAGGCISDPASRDLILGQMSRVTIDTWGIGSSGVPGKWKGGWGPGSDGKYLVRQMGVMSIGGDEAVVTIAAIPDDGTFESGQAMATSIATWVASNLAGKIPDSAPC